MESLTFAIEFIVRLFSQLKPRRIPLRDIYQRGMYIRRLGHVYYLLSVTTDGKAVLQHIGKFPHIKIESDERLEVSLRTLHNWVRRNTCSRYWVRQGQHVLVKSAWEKDAFVKNILNPPSRWIVDKIIQSNDLDTVVVVLKTEVAGKLVTAETLLDLFNTRFCLIDEATYAKGVIA